MALSAFDDKSKEPKLWIWKAYWAEAALIGAV